MWDNTVIFLSVPCGYSCAWILLEGVLNKTPNKWRSSKRSCSDTDFRFLRDFYVSPDPSSSVLREPTRAVKVICIFLCNWLYSYSYKICKKKKKTRSYFIFWGTRWRSWLRHCATSRKVAVRFPMVSLELFIWHNPSGRTMVLTQPLTEMSIKNISWGGKGGRCVGLTNLSPSCADCLEIWEPQPPGILRVCPGLSVALPLPLLYILLRVCISWYLPPNTQKSRKRQTFKHFEILRCVDHNECLISNATAAAGTSNLTKTY